MYVCLLVRGGLMEIQIPTAIWMKFLYPYPHLSKEGFGEGLTPSPSPWAWGA